MTKFNITYLRGQRFGRLIVMGVAERVNEKTYWLCRCDCGKVISALQSDLRSGRTASCKKPECKALALQTDVVHQQAAA